MKPVLPLASGFRLGVRILNDSKAAWPRLLLLFLIALAAMPLALLTPVPLKLVVDHVLNDKPIHSALKKFDPLALACVLTLLVALLQALQTTCSWIYQRALGENLVLQMRTRVLKHIQDLSFLQSSAKGTPDLLYRMQNDALHMQYFAISALIPFLTSLITFSLMFYVTVRLDPTLAFIALATLPVLALLSRWHGRRSFARWGSVKENDRDAIGVMQETLNCSQVVRAFGQSGQQIEKFKWKSFLYIKAYLKALATDGIFGVIVALTLALATTATIYVGVQNVRQNLLTLGDFLIVLAYLTQLLKSLEVFSKQASATQNALASGARVYQLLDETPTLQNASPLIPLQRARGRVEFHGVNFVYDANQKDHQALTNVSFAIPAGSRVGIRGVSGSGKTTLLRLLTRVCDPTSGRVLLDGIDLRHIPAADLTRQFAQVPQEPVLFSGTVAENIAYGKPNASMTDIRRAATEAGIHEEITNWPNGYETQVGERGSTLSGGERQRISIARAFLMDAPVLILDEPSSALDENRGDALARSITKLCHDRTVFIVSHRSEFFIGTDAIIELDSGHSRLVVERVKSQAQFMKEAPNCENAI